MNCTISSLTSLVLYGNSCKYHQTVKMCHVIQNAFIRHLSSSSVTLQRTVPVIRTDYSRLKNVSIVRAATPCAAEHFLLRNKQKKYRNKRPKYSSRLNRMKEDVRTIPNLLTVSRMISAPFLSYLVIHGNYHWAVALFTVAGFTDILDGYIARRYKSQQTVLGTALDPLADKLLVCVLTVSLSLAQLLPVWLTVIILLRDAALVGASAYTRYQVLPPPKSLVRFFDVTLPTAKIYPSNLSKLNTALQLSSVGFTLAAPVFGYIDHPYLHALWYITAGTTVASGLGYWLQAKKSFSIIKHS